MSELLSCPCCGEKARIDRYEHFYRVLCMDCPVLTEWLYSEQEAIDAWNTRVERTCHPFVSPDGAGWYAIGCSNCGHGFADNNPDKEYLLRISKRSDIMPRYCSGCGAKVIEQ